MFQEVNARIETAFTIIITYMEIYNEKIFDLLVDPATDTIKARQVFTKETQGSQIFVKAVAAMVCFVLVYRVKRAATGCKAAGLYCSYPLFGRLRTLACEAEICS